MKSRLHNFIIFFFATLFGTADAQLAKQWDHRYGGTSQDYCESVIQTRDGGYLLGGYTTSALSGDISEASFGGEDYWVIKLNNIGVKEWDKRFGGTANDELFQVVQCTDGSFLLGGQSNSPASGNKTATQCGLNDLWLVKIDEDGNYLWDKGYGSDQQELFGAIALGTRGGIIIGGSSNGGITCDKTDITSGGKDYWVVYTNSWGEYIWI
jgi:hypothetical protein